MQALQDRFIALHQVPEHGATSYIPLTHAVVIVSGAQGILLVFNRKRGVWELPGGMIDCNESSRSCALRELHEETAMDIPNLRWLGIMELDLQPSRRNPTRRIEFGALFGGELAGPVPAHESEEVAEVGVWPSNALPEPLGPIDAHLLGLYRHGGLARQW